MKISAGKAESFIKAPPTTTAAILLFGPDEGVRLDRLKSLRENILGESPDPFDFIELAGDQLSEQKSRLADEAAAISFSGNRRVVVVRDTKDTHTKTLKEYFDSTHRPDHGFIIIEAGELTPRSSLRQLFEKQDNLAAVGCYSDEGPGLNRLITEALRQHGKAAEPDALAYLQHNLGNNRLLTQQELEKLALYCGDEPTISLAHVQAIIEDNSGGEAEEIAHFVAEGAYNAVDQRLAKLLIQGVSPILVLLNCQRHLQKILIARVALDAGQSLKMAVDSIKPPIFFKVRSRFESQAQSWSQDSLAKAFEALNKCERQLKSTGTSGQKASETLLRAALFRCAHIAANSSRQKRQGTA